jgi:hypothetical protein
MGKVDEYEAEIEMAYDIIEQHSFFFDEFAVGSPEWSAEYDRRSSVRKGAFLAIFELRALQDAARQKEERERGL